jgi:uncharacterized membrane protein
VFLRVVGLSFLVVGHFGTSCILWGTLRFFYKIFITYQKKKKKKNLSFLKMLLAAFYPG